MSSAAAETVIERLYLICLGYRTVDTPTGPREANYAAYLIQTKDGRNLLVDSGFPEGMQPRDANGALPPDVVTQLGEIGIAPHAIDTLICTHYDLDHCGQNNRFANAVHVVQRRQHEEAVRGYERYQRGRPYWDAPQVTRQLLEGDVALAPGIELLDTSGHAPGHQSLLLTLPTTGKVLLTIDAVPRQNLLTADRNDFGMNEDKGAARQSTLRLLDVVKHRQPALVVFGHDGPQWHTLRVLPAYYT